MPNVTSKLQAVREFEYLALPGSGRYRIARPTAGSPDWWFIVNHRSGSGASQFHTYIGIFIAKRLEHPLANSLQLLRNGGWHKLGGGDLKDFQHTYESWADFFDLQDTDASQESFQQIFGDWHAIPDPRTDESSWLQRRNWLSKPRLDECFQAIGGQRPASSNVFFQARLIRFRVTAELNSRSPVVWSIGLRDADAFFMKTFSPEGIDLNGEYCVAVE